MAVSSTNEPVNSALVTSDPVVLGILVVVLGLVLASERSPHPFWRRFYSVVPALLLCYFIPGLLNTFGVINGESSRLYPMARDYLLPMALVLLTLACDLGAIVRLGPKAIILFLTGTTGVILGAPVALAIMGFFDPSLLNPEGPNAIWRGMTTTAGSWIGGGANQAAMKEVYAVGADVFGKFVAVDVICANIWMAFLLFLAGRSARLDAWRGADTRALDDLRVRVEKVQLDSARIAGSYDMQLILAYGLGATGLAHWMASYIVPFIKTNAPHLERYSLTANFFWVTVLATTFGLMLSFTRAKKLEGAGASKFGSVAIYILVATIGMQMNLGAIFSDPELFALGLIWISFHGALMLGMAWLIKAPVFYMAVGSQANIGGAASAPVVASAFHPALAPVGVLLAVLGYGLGTYGGWIAGQLLRLLTGA
ncbi:hypothetical protein ASD15_28415 [Massilia sp. Root351]|jgi:uncharacterized membrane protein|uniref:DUF819 family protein n=1 Tax=Massilia sp. Root351 TaxID=1736522 RepID=UPI00070EC358|nr:DUF819 family protein [Massilia sp. Root351]KQV87168.1 hypothetical protein ASD15_28415 [Massilia sp. Root351]